jgi:hypothetical protein
MPRDTCHLQLTLPAAEPTSTGTTCATVRSSARQPLLWHASPSRGSCATKHTRQITGHSTSCRIRPRHLIPSFVTRPSADPLSRQPEQSDGPERRNIRRSVSDEHLRHGLAVARRNGCSGLRRDPAGSRRSHVPRGALGVAAGSSGGLRPIVECRIEPVRCGDEGWRWRRGAARCQRCVRFRGERAASFAGLSLATRSAKISRSPTGRARSRRRIAAGPDAAPAAPGPAGCS